MQENYFHLAEVEPQELFCILLDHFSQAEGTKFQRPGTQHSLEMIGDKAGNIERIQLSEDFPRSELEEIEKKIQDTLLTEHETKVSQLIAFCGAEVTGYFRYKDLFQILPMPDDAPKVVFFIPSSYPFILEVSYQSCPNQFIEGARLREKTVIYTRLLNLLFNQGISPSPLVGQNGWVIKTDDPSNITSEWKQLGYFYTGLKGSMDSFSSVENINPLERTPFIKYYFEPLTKPSVPLTLPDTLEPTLDKAFALDQSTWRKFFMACGWYAQYQPTWAVSHSSAFIALVTALECLAQEKEICATCRQPILENSEDIL